MRSRQRPKGPSLEACGQLTDGRRMRRLVVDLSPQLVKQGFLQEGSSRVLFQISGATANEILNRVEPHWDSPEHRIPLGGFTVLKVDPFCLHRS